MSNKVIVVINDSSGVFQLHQNTGIIHSVNRRSVSIELTDDQMNKIKLNKGEVIESISFSRFNRRGIKTTTEQ